MQTITDDCEGLRRDLRAAELWADHLADELRDTLARVEEMERELDRIEVRGYVAEPVAAGE